ncbi:MAG TPA: BamA/TamA family outer membrane protein [Anaeromyxobacteraceae bacterium]|nr:BamA/TamA family outer membrane protein [Anaeromyxobacteraceae bacterium]
MVARALALVVAALACGAAAPPEEHGPPREGAEETAAEAAAKKPARGWFVLPMLFWLPETKAGLAGAAGVHFRPHGADRPSSAFLVVGYTMEKQGSVDLSSDVYLPGGSLVSGRFRAVHFPDAFYGIGPSTSVQDRELYTRRFLELNATAELPVLRGRLRAGPRLNARVEEIRDVEPGGLLDAGLVDGADGFSAIGLGVSVTWDTRDRPLGSTRGSFVQASYVHHPAALADNDGFGRGWLEARLFRPLGRETILGLAALLETADGETPFSLLPKLGSTRFLRGYREGRFRDQIAWAAQAEVRTPLTARISGAAFAAIGDVAKDFASLRADTIKLAGGIGARFRLTGEGANLRLDVAASRAGPEVYLLLLDAF